MHLLKTFAPRTQPVTSLSCSQKRANPSSSLPNKPTPQAHIVLIWDPFHYCLHPTYNFFNYILPLGGFIQTKIFRLYTLVTHNLTFLLIPLSRVLSEELTDPQIIRIFSAFYETRRFIAAFTGTRHLSPP